MVQRDNPLLKNGLFVRRPLSNLILRFLSFLAQKPTYIPPIPKNPKKILLSNIANFGDVVISTTVLPLIKQAYPDCEIGFLTSTNSKVVLENHPLISHLHTYDHWYLHKCKAALHFKTCKRLLKELRQTSYDLAIDLYPYFPNTIPLLAKSGIPIRIGYPTGGFSKLLTHSMPWQFPDRYASYAHHHLLTPLGIDITQASPLPFYRYGRQTKPYIVIHMGSSTPLKEWEESKWIELISKLKKDGHTIFLTGKGDRETAICNRVAEKTGVKNLADQLNWAEFVLKIQEAQLVISVDSAATHITAAVKVPLIVLFSKINPPEMWAPPSSKVYVPMEAVHPHEVYKTSVDILRSRKKALHESTYNNALLTD